MASVNLNDLSLDELRALNKEVSEAIITFEEVQRQRAVAAVEATAREMGFTLQELVSPVKKNGRKPTVAKYRHPENPSITWPGRGRKPRWFKDALENGLSPEDLEI